MIQQSRIVDMVGVLEQIAPGDRYVRVFGHEERLEAGLLHHPGQVGDVQV